MKTAELNDAVLLWGCASENEVSDLLDSMLLVPENRPFMYGLRNNLPMLKQFDAKHVYCTDNMIGALYAKGKIRDTIVFYRQRISPGVFLCPTGSLYVCLLSKLHDVDVLFRPQGNPRAPTDRDASTLEGRTFILEKDRAFVIKPEDEIVEEALIKDHQNV